MRIRKYTYVDVHYDKNEHEIAMKERKRLIKLGYKLSVEDDGGTTDYCDQYIKELQPKFIVERSQTQQSEMVCPECLSNRILDWPDKYQCRKCEHVWEREAK